MFQMHCIFSQDFTQVYEASSKNFPSYTYTPPFVPSLLSVTGWKQEWDKETPRPIHGMVVEYPGWLVIDCHCQLTMANMNLKLVNGNRNNKTNFYLWGIVGAAALTVRSMTMSLDYIPHYIPWGVAAQIIQMQAGWLDMKSVCYEAVSLFVLYQRWF